MMKPLHHKSEAPLTSWAARLSASLPQIALVTLLAITFALGGSSRGDIEFAAVAQTLAMFCLGIAFTTLRLQHLQGFGLPILLALAAAVLPVLQLVPLPPQVWQSLPGRGLIADIDRAAGLGLIWRPLTMTPPETTLAALSGLTPLAILMLAIQLQPKQQMRLALLPLTLGAVSAMLGLLQLLGDPQGSLYLFASTNFGSAVGLFANRNHQAVMLACLIPLAFAAARLRWSKHATSSTRSSRPGQSLSGRRTERLEWRMPLAIAAVCMLVPLALITGSRSGLIMTVFALVTLPFVIREERGHKVRHRISNPAWLAIAAFVVAMIAGAAIWLGRDAALDRLFASSPADDLRLQMLPTIIELAKTHWLWGTGIGSFERLYQIHEPAELLLPQYVNHAHNDWLEIVVTGGLPAIVLLVIGLLAIARRTWQIAGEAPGDSMLPLRRAALVSMIILALASISDYPLRTPYLSAFLALCATWLFAPRPAQKDFGEALAHPLPTS